MGMARLSHQEVDTVIIGGGPSSLILSYILHGHIPYYKGGHHDRVLDSKLRDLPDLLHISSETYSHFGNSLRYSQQALPINALLDTLVRPNADTEIDPPSCIEWRYEPHRAVSHLILTDVALAGGQWTQTTGTPSDDIGTLSYSEMLSLPGYSFAEHYTKVNQTAPPDLMRPSRTEVAAYYAAYPQVVGISSVFRPNTWVSRISRNAYGFTIGFNHILCRNIVLATGIFTHEISMPTMLSPIKKNHNSELPLLVVGSGFSAADAILAASSHRQIIHLFKWNPLERPSPLKGCHHQAYPEYAGVYRQMKGAATRVFGNAAASPFATRKRNPFFNQRDWVSIYEGIPNAQIVDVQQHALGSKIVFRHLDGSHSERLVGDIEYHVGRRGSLAYLDSELLQEIIPGHKNNIATSQTLRERVEISSEITPHVFTIGSLTGDSLVRHAFGCCVSSASRILSNVGNKEVEDIQCEVPPLRRLKSRSLPPEIPDDLTSSYGSLHVCSPEMRRAHDDLHIDRRDLMNNKFMQSRELLSPGN